MPEGEDEIELLMGVSSSETEARAVVERVKDTSGFVEFQMGFQIHPYQLNRDYWSQGFTDDQISI
jgi:hypothetical protein